MSELLIIVVAFWGLLSLFIAGDADQNEMTPWWGLAVFFTGIIGLAFYAIMKAE